MRVPSYPSVVVQLNGKPYAGVEVDGVTYVIWTLAKKVGADLTKVAYGDVEINGKKPPQVMQGGNTYIKWSYITGIVAHKIEGGFNFSTGLPPQKVTTWQTYQNSGKPLPQTYPDQRQFFPPISIQDVLDACTAFATIDTFISLRVRAGLMQAAALFSPLGEWAMSRKLYGNQIGNPNYVNENQGVTEDDALDVLVDDGVVPMADDLWDTQVMTGNWVKAYQTLPPPGDWLSNIKLRRDQVYQIDLSDRAKALADVLDALAHEWPVLITKPVYLSYMNVGGDGMIPMPGATNDPYQGLHQTVLTSANGTLTAALERNSWGPTWGIQTDPTMNGYGWLPYEYIQQYAMELFVLKP